MSRVHNDLVLKDMECSIVVDVNLTFTTANPLTQSTELWIIHEVSVT